MSLAARYEGWDRRRSSYRPLQTAVLPTRLVWAQIKAQYLKDFDIHFYTPISGLQIVFVARINV